jgi:hypothetical protein
MFVVDRLCFPTKNDGSGVEVSSIGISAEITFKLCEMVKAPASQPAIGVAPRTILSLGAVVATVEP